MENEQYELVQSQILTIAGIVKLLPLKDFIEAADKADAVGAFLDPTLYRAASKKLAVIIQLARGLKGFQDVATEVAHSSPA